VDQAHWQRWDGNQRQGTCAVGSFAAGDSPLGLHDMAGNVWEWTSSLYSPGYAKERTGPARVIRGGGWTDHDASQVRAANRFQGAQGFGEYNLGFRCVR